jgi:hypothetical protein
MSSLTAGIFTSFEHFDAKEVSGKLDEIEFT